MSLRIFAVFGLLVSLAVCPAQQPSETVRDTWWFNFPAAPVRFEREGKVTGPIGLRNHSSKRVTDYDFGCVELSSKGTKITKRFWGSSITDGGYGRKHFWPPFGPKDTDKDESYAKGMCKGSKIAIVWVVFDGGDYWAAPGVVLIRRSF